MSLTFQGILKIQTGLEMSKFYLMYAVEVNLSRLENNTHNTPDTAQQVYLFFYCTQKKDNYVDFMQDISMHRYKKGFEIYKI